MNSDRAGRRTGRRLARLAGLALLAAATGALAQGPSRQSHPSNSTADVQMSPKQSPWQSIPTSGDLRACVPDAANPPPGRAVAECRVGAQGGLENCDLGEIHDAGLKRVAACILPKFRAKLIYRDKLVRAPIQLTSEPAGR